MILSTTEAAVTPQAVSTQAAGGQASIPVSIPLQAEVHPAPETPALDLVPETPVAQHMKPLHREWGSSTVEGDEIEQEEEQKEGDGDESYRDMPTVANLFGSDLPSEDSQG